MALNAIQKNLLSEIMDLEIVPEGAYNIRANGEGEARHTTANIDIVTKTDKPGIDIIIRPGTKNERVDIPVLLTKTGLKDLVYNDFYIGEDADVLIVAGCGIHNAGDEETAHDGIHSFHVGKNAKLKYVEKHYGEGEGTGEKVLNPTTEIEIAEGGYMEIESAQLGGVDSTVRVTRAKLADRATLVIGEKIMTHGKQTAVTDFTVDLDGENCGAHVVSRSVAKDESRHTFLSCINGNNCCSGHTECDAIIMDSARVDAIPKVAANHVQASLIHEAAIGKIAGEQLIKLMTLGLSEKQAEEQMLHAQVFVLHLLGAVAGGDEGFFHIVGNVDLVRLAARARHARHARDERFEARGNFLRRFAHFGQKLGNQPLRIGKQRKRQMLLRNFLMMILHRQLLRHGKGFAAFFGKLLIVHIRDASLSKNRKRKRLTGRSDLSFDFL